MIDTEIDCAIHVDMVTYRPVAEAGLADALAAFLLLCARQPDNADVQNARLRLSRHDVITLSGPATRTATCRDRIRAMTTCSALTKVM